jgi:Chitobiase/beta-hexosaminidase C-terminal domain
MKNIPLLFLLLISYPLFAQDTFQLAPPLLKYNTIFFSDKTMVEIKFAQSQTSVRYTLNNLEPTINDLVYKKPVIIKNNFTTLKAKAFGNDFHPSATVYATFIKDGKAIQSIQQTTPNTKYAGSGDNTLVDNKGGLEQLSSNTWMGYNCDTVTITMNLTKQESVNSVLLNFLQNESAWIFLPDKIIVQWFDKNLNSYQIFGEEKLLADTETSGSYCNYRIIKTTNEVITEKILINIIVKKIIPSWHPAKGEHAWMFIDEIKVY